MRSPLKYPHAIANWPTEDRPREKLLQKGPDSLSKTPETALVRAALRNKAGQIALEVEGLTEPGEEDKELLEIL
jgi:DNA repair protein RadC